VLGIPNMATPLNSRGDAFICCGVEAVLLIACCALASPAADREALLLLKELLMELSEP
jgi:hypothetical protein